ncbi:hypothetical protein KIPB_011169 [Kipferlia bialata]|uniref:Uncharacterized protein n=1 Tax=Kipferlia bialata TaxID=797122 RepID=A0A9K3GM35_9EUKA|nr:hypothetical protein KIPB_011169 [Kipferlia bialata]|eukprot:g11169.t1
MSNMEEPEGVEIIPIVKTTRPHLEDVVALAMRGVEAQAAPLYASEAQKLANLRQIGFVCANAGADGVRGNDGANGYCGENGQDEGIFRHPATGKPGGHALGGSDGGHGVPGSQIMLRVSTTGVHNEDIAFQVRYMAPTPSLQLAWRRRDHSGCC